MCGIYSTKRYKLLRFVEAYEHKVLLYVTEVKSQLSCANYGIEAIVSATVFIIFLSARNSSFFRFHKDIKVCGTFLHPEHNASGYYTSTYKFSAVFLYKINRNIGRRKFPKAVKCIQLLPLLCAFADGP